MRTPAWSGGRAISLPPVLLALVYLGGAAAAYALKAFFSGAGADDLRWVLAPTCWLAAALGGMSFTDEAGAGFISHGDRLVVGAACSGVNFLIVCFAALFFSYARRWRHPGARAAWLIASGALAYAATIVTNAVRVVVAARLFRADIYEGLLTPGRAHRIMGALLYCGALVVIHGLAGRVLAARAAATHPAPFSVDAGGRARRLPPWLLASPLTWYLAVALGVPLFRLRADSLDARFAEHLLTVAGAAGMLALAVVVARTLGDRIQSKSSGGAPSS